MKKFISILFTLIFINYSYAQSTFTAYNFVATHTISGAAFTTYFASPPAIGGTAPGTGAFTTLSATGLFTSTLATGTAPFSVASTTPVTNLSIGGNAATATTATNLATGTINKIPFQSGTGTTSFISAVNGAVVNTSSSGVPSETATPVLGVNGTTTGTIGLATSTVSGATTTIQPSAITSAATITLPATTGTLLISGGALGTPSSGVATNLTGTATALNIGGNAATATSATSATSATTATTATNLSGGTVSATTVTATTGAITPHYPTGIVGITSGAAITAGSIGEQIVGTGTAVSLVNGTAKSITSVALTAGNWLIYASAALQPAGTTTVSAVYVGVSATTNTLPAIPFYAGNNIASPAGDVEAFTAPVFPVNNSGSVTYFCVMVANFAVSTATSTCQMTAVRIS